MFSIIVPTMWRYAPFVEFLQELTLLDLIDEIIIINNDVKNTPNSNILKSSKIKLHNVEQNIYVNPAWNLGVKLSNNKKICIMNDDIKYDLSIFSLVNTVLDDSVGLIGLISKVDRHHNIINSNQKVVLDPIPFYTAAGLWYIPWHLIPQYGHEFPYGIGQLMFVYKDNWRDIPEELKVFCGDCYIYDTQQLAGKKIFGIKNLQHYTPFSVTSKNISNSFIEFESPFYSRFISNYKKNIFIKRGNK